MRETGRTEMELFPLTVDVINVTTSAEFLATILNPAWTFARTFRFLSAALRGATRCALPETARALWLAMGPAFAGSRTTARTGREWVPQHPHDFPVPTTVMRSIARVGERETFANYLA